MFIYNIFHRRQVFSLLVLFLFMQQLLFQMRHPPFLNHSHEAKKKKKIMENSGAFGHIDNIYCRIIIGTRSRPKHIFLPICQIMRKQSSLLTVAHTGILFFGECCNNLLVIMYENAYIKLLYNKYLTYYYGVNISLLSL